MVLEAKSGTFTASASTGNQAVTGIGFQPKAIIFFTIGNTVVGNRDNAVVVYGAASSSSARGASALHMVHEDNPSNVDSASRTTRCIIAINGAGTVIGEADFVSFDSDGFTVNWSTAFSNVQVHFLAIGGTDFSNAKVASFSKATSTGNQAITGVGFQPDLVLLFGDLMTGDSSTHTSFFIGAAISSSSRWCYNSLSKNAFSGGNTARAQRTDRVVNQFDEDKILVASADFVSMDSDGFTINYSTADGTASRYHYIAMKGGQYDLGSFTQPGATGNQAVTGVGFQPRGEKYGNFNNAATTSLVNAGSFGIGSSTATAERNATTHGASDGVGDMEAESNDSVTRCIRMELANEIFTGSADFVSHDSDGFTVNWDIVSGGGRQALYMAVGDNGGPPPPVPTPDLSDQFWWFYWSRKFQEEDF